MSMEAVALRAGRYREIVLVCLSAATLLAVACHGTNRVYRASALPVELMPAPRMGWRQADLAKLAVPGGSSDQLQPGDLVELSIATGLEDESPVAYRLRVSDDGNLAVPLVGPVAVAGLTVAQAERRIAEQSVVRGTYVSPNVSLLLVQRRSHRITVAGAVRKPGTYLLPASSSTVLAAIVAAEGFSEEAGTVVEIRRPTPEPMWTAAPGSPAVPAGYVMPASAVVTIDLAHGPQDIRDVLLEDGATVVVRPKEKDFIYVTGLVRKPDRYELPADRDLRLLDALAMAGGRTLEVADKVRVIRQLGGDSSVVIRASVREAARNHAANLVLAPGDVVTVDETPLTFVVGTIQNFVRFGFTSAIPGF
ncbi:MAG: hypothetical protein KatS3mg110_1724 [Pirellulaceae bacterium]|nr:MAG: hypothetical protein KatS3mg110_1724 [Pirellulaceae bacterium]